MNERMNIIDQEHVGRNSNPFGEYERTTGEGSAYFMEQTQFVRNTIMELQSQDKLPSAPMSDTDRNYLVLAFIQALDRGLCPDEAEDKREWILDSASCIYSASSSKPSFASR